jgi:hypothetical protein
MNAGTCWGKNTIDPRGRSVEKPREVPLTFLTLRVTEKDRIFSTTGATVSFL